MKSRIISAFLALTMLLSVNVQVFAENTPDVTPDISAEQTVTEATVAPVNTDAPKAEASPSITIMPTATVNTVTASPDVTVTPKLDDKKETVIRVSTLEEGTTDLSQPLNNGAVEINQSGSYTISDVTTTNSIVIKANTNVNLTIKNVSITSSTTSPILIETGAVLTLTLEGENTINANAKYFPGIAVLATETDDSKLFIEGNGKLDITTTQPLSVGIGAAHTSANITPKSTSIHGEITINSGILNIDTTASKTTPAIGAATTKPSRRGYDITINGGTVTALGGQAGIGASGSGSAASRNANIIINGGTIVASGTYRGIGGNSTDANNGSVIINGGNVTATSTLGNSAGIQATNNVTINGGNVTTTGSGKNSSGINVASPTDSRIEINGGSIKATGTNSMTSGTGTTAKAETPVNKYDRPLIATDISIPGLGNEEVGVGAGKSMTAADGSLLCYIPENTKAFYVTHTDTDKKQVIYYTEDIFAEGGSELKLYDGPPCSCDEDTLKAIIDMPSEIVVARLDGQKTETLAAHLENPACTFPIHEYEMYYELTMPDGSAVDTSLAYLDGNQLVIKYDAKGQTLRVHAIFDINNMEIRGTHDIEVASDDVSKFDLSKGNITIGADKLTNNPDMMCITVGSTPLDTKQYILPRGDEITIFQSSSTATSYNIRISVDASVVLDNINIQTNNEDVLSGYTVKLDDNLTATLLLKGDNKMLAKQCQAITANDTANLIIKGDGSLNVTSNDGAAIGGMNTLTIDGGAVTAKGGNGGAGIGGDSHNANGINVVVNDGRVYATGSITAAGIGGGQGGQGGSFTINGGMVIAKNGSVTGNGIGDGGNPRNPGTITINGGSVNATLPERDETYYNANLSYVNKPQYLLIIQPEGITGQQNVTYTIDESAPIMTSTDSEGKLYLYPDSGQRWIRITTGGKTYYRYLLVNADKPEKTEIAVLNAIPKLKTFEIAGQIGETKIDEANSTVNVTVPYNILLDSIKPVFTYDGALISDNVTLDFNNESHTAELTILGDDKSTKKYTITLTLAPPPSDLEAEELDISKGSIWITDNYITYAGVRYAINPKGYTITGTATDNVIIVNSIDGGTIPPITLKDLNMTNNSSIPLRFSAVSNVTVEGECVINTNNNYALRCEQGSHGKTIVNITGDGRLFMQSSSNCCYIDSQSTASINLPVMSIVSDRKAVDGNGELILVSDAYVKFSGKQDSNVRTVNSDGETLYQLTAHLDTTNRVGNECTYNDDQYYLDDNNDICLMLPDGKYPMKAVYDDTQFDGTAEINGAPVNLTLKTMKVDKVEYDNSRIPFTGKDIDFAITTSSVPENTPVKVVLTPDKEGLETLTADAIITADGRYTVTITVPANESTTERVRYTVSVFLDQKEFIQNLKLVVDVDNSVARITAFEIEGQIGDTIISDTNKTVSVYFPYDHEFDLVSNSTPKRYRIKPSKLEYMGSSIDHGENETVEFVEDVNGYLRSYYYVTAANGESTRYTVRLYFRPTPRITTLRFNNRLTSAGGTVTVTATGASTNYIQSASKPANRKVYIYSDGDPDKGIAPIAPVEAEQVMVDNGAGAMVATFVANITVPQNTDDTNDTVYILKAKIGNTEQTAVGTLTVSRIAKNNANMKSFTLENQLSSTFAETGLSEIQILVMMPFDADITQLTPAIELEDVNASYSPMGEIDFTSPQTYTVTAEDRVTTKAYNVIVSKEPEPVVTEVEFTSPRYSSAGRVEFKLIGQNLESSLHALSGQDCIEVICTPTDGGSPISAKAKQTSDGSFTATLTIPSNTEITEKTYTVEVNIADKVQTLTGNTTLIVPGREPDSCELTDIVLIDGQSVPMINDNDVTLLVPYNTDLGSITPVLTHTGADYSPKGAQNFNNDITYTIIAPSGKTKEFIIHTYRDNQARVFNIVAGNAGRLTSYAPKDVAIKIVGNFIPYITAEDKVNGNINDTITMTLTPKNGGDPIQATIEYTAYGGEAIAHISAIPPNETEEDVQYVATVTLNGVQQDIGFSNIITVPCKKTCAITEFIVSHQIGTSVINDITDTESTISFSMPYEADIRAIEPTINMDADTITPTGAQNFEIPVEYILTAEGMPDHKYTVTANRVGAPSINTVTMSAAPTTFKGGMINVGFEGVFHHEAKLEAVPNDGSDTIKGVVTMNERHKAEAVLNLPVNTTYSDREYTLVFYLDGFEDGIYSDYTITVPRRTSRAITKFEIAGVQDGETRIEGTNIYVDIPYYRFAEIESVVPEIEYDADTITPNEDAAQNFRDTANPVKYTLTSADDEAVTYTVHINYVGDKPQIKSFTVDKQKKETVYENDTISIVLPSSAKLKEIEPIIEFVGVDYSPKGAQDFSNSKKEPIVYTVVDKYGIEQKYNVTITKQKSSSKSKATPTPTVKPTKEPEGTPNPTANSTVKPTNKPYMSGYEDGTYRPDNTITRAEVATILSMLDDSFNENEHYDNTAYDVNPDAWYANYIGFASAKGYMSGYEDGTYRPDNTITRAEFASMIARYIGINPLDGENKFADIDNVPWCSQQINALSESGIVSGYEDGLFKPQNYMTRAESASIINRALGKEIPEDVLDRLMCPYEDITASHWAYIDTMIASCEF